MSVTDEEFKELGYTRQESLLMYAIDVECDVIQLRKSKLGLQSTNMVDHLKCMELYEPQRHKQAAEEFYDYAMEQTRKKNEI